MHTKFCAGYQHQHFNCANLTCIAVTKIHFDVHILCSVEQQTLKALV